MAINRWNVFSEFDLVVVESVFHAVQTYIEIYPVNNARVFLRDDGPRNLRHVEVVGVQPGCAHNLGKVAEAAARAVEHHSIKKMRAA